MARSSSAKNGKSSKNTYRASGSKSSKSSSSGARHNSSASGSKKRMSRLEQRRAQQQNLIRSVVLAGLGILAIALVLVPGQSFWNVLRSWLFGTFGVVTYFVGPFLLYLAYLLASGYHVGTFIGKVLLLAVLLAGTAVIFSDFKVGDTPWQTVKMLFAWGQRKFWTGGVLGVPIGASLLAVCGRPGANIVMIIVILMGLMVFFAVTPVDVVQFISYYIQEFKARRAARAEEETAYDTQLFGHEAEEESLENLTGSLPPMAGESPATPQPGTRRPFDVAPYLEQEEAARAMRPRQTLPTRQPPRRRPASRRPSPSRRIRSLAPQHTPICSVPRLRPKACSTPKALPRLPSVRTLMWTWGRMLPSALCRTPCSMTRCRKLRSAPAAPLALTRWSS